MVAASCMCPGWVFTVSCLTESLCKDQPVDMPLGVTVCNVLLITFKSGVSTTHRPVVLLNICPTDLQCQIFWGFLFLEQDPHSGEPSCGAWIPCSLGRTIVIVAIFPLVGCLPRAMGLDHMFLCPPTYFIMASSLSLQLQIIFYAGVQVVLMDSCSVNSYDLGLPVGEGELSVFLDTILTTH